jgi:hypothetical protein
MRTSHKMKGKNGGQINLLYILSSPNKDSGAVSIVVLQLIGGLITTLTFIIMMKSSQSSPKSMRSTQFVL